MNNLTQNIKLPEPAHYFPIKNGKYEVDIGFFQFGTDFGNGLQDKLFFQIDKEFFKYREEKMISRNDNLSNYHGFFDYSEQTEKAVTKFIINGLLREHPNSFKIEELGKDEFIMHCHLTEESLHFTNNKFVSDSKKLYKNSLDALASQLQEDIAVTTLKNNSNWISAVHVCMPSHWSPKNILGKDFNDVHKPVAGFEKVAKTAPKTVRAMVHKGPYVRFVWD